MHTFTNWCTPAPSDLLETWFDLAGAPPVFSVAEIVPVRCGLCALARCRDAYGETATEFLNVFRNDRAGETRRSVIFDLDDIDAALAELERVHRESDTDTSA